MIDKHNITQIIDEYLKTNKIRYTIIEQDVRMVLYQIFIGSMDGFIQIEYDLDSSSENILITYYSNVNDDNGLSLYESVVDNYDSPLTQINVEGEIEQLIDQVKILNKAVAKIGQKIEQIREICEEYNLEIEEFIEVIYNFED